MRSLDRSKEHAWPFEVIGEEQENGSLNQSREDTWSFEAIDEERMMGVSIDPGVTPGHSRPLEKKRKTEVPMSQKRYKSFLLSLCGVVVNQ